MAITHAKVSTHADPSDTSLVGKTDWNAAHVGTLPAGSVAHSDLTGLTVGDDHTQYQKESEKGAASGYAALDSGILVPIAQLPTMVASGASHAKGIVPDPGAVSGTSKFLREDASWQTPPGASGGTPAVVLGSAAAAGSSGTFLRDDDTIAAFDGTAPTTLTVAGAAATGSAAKAARRDHTHGMPSAFVASGGSHAAGFVPDPGASAGTTKFLREDATFAIPPGTGNPVASDTIWDTKGDLAVATAADTATKLAVGSNGQVLTADSTQATGTRWATPTVGTTFVGCRVKNSGAQTITNATDTALTFDQEDFDTDAIHSTGASTSKITIPTGLGGYWIVGYEVFWDVNASGNRRYHIYKNGSSGTPFGEHIQASSTGLVGMCASGQTLLSLADADYLEIWVYQNSTASVDVVAAGTAFWAYKVG